MMSCFPTTTRILTQRCVDALVPANQVDFKPPRTFAEAGGLLARTFINIGLQNRFAQIVLVLGHGSRSVNTPLDAAHNWEGGPNARLMARYANEKVVRQHLLKDKGTFIPDDTWLVGGYHDTTSELVELLDLDRVPALLGCELVKARSIIDEARVRNAFERCDKFMLANVRTQEEAVEHVHTHSMDLAEGGNGRACSSGW